MIYFSHSAMASEMQRLPRKQIGRTAVRAGLPSAVNLSASPPASSSATQLRRHTHVHNKQSTESFLLPVCADPLKACAAGSG